MAPTRPSIQGDTLVYEHARTTRSLTVGGAAWYTWLTDATRFRFANAQGSYTARQERVRGPGQCAYWYAYRKRDGTLRKVYLGRSADLTLERLSAAATALAPTAAATATDAAMRSGPHAPVTPAAARATPLLATKLSVPRVRPTLLARPHLLARLHAGLAGPLTLLSAPAGFGKTTLLGAWRAAAGSTVPLAWVSLDSADRDPARFWSYVCTALDQLHPGVAAAALPALQSLDAPPLEVILTSVLNALSTLPADAVLVLDDYHVLQSPAIQTGMAFLLDHLPPPLHLVIATREDPLLPLARLRARGQLLELRAADLRFTAEETAHLLQTVLDLPLSDTDVAALATQTEGWIAGLQLAALAMRDRADPAGFIQRFTGSNRFVLDYLADEVLHRLSSRLQSFLLHTSILDRLCSSLCAAVVGGEAAGDAPASQAVLEELERANLFLIPLDDARVWYRYHHLFADVLRARLHAGAAPEQRAELHRRAGLWYEHNGFPVEAVDHTLTAGDWETAARRIEQATDSVMRRGAVQTLLGWLNALPDALLRARPLLCIFHAAALMNTNQLQAAEARLQDAEQAVRPEMPPEQVRLIRGRLALVRANLVRVSGDTAGCIALARRALELLPETDVMARAAVTTNVVRAYQITGDVTSDAEREIVGMAALARASGNPIVLVHGLTTLAGLQLLQGRLRQAAATYTEAAHAASGPGGLRLLVGSPAYAFGLGDLLREWNDLDAAERQVREGMDLIDGPLTVEAEVVALGYLASARLQRARGDTARALGTLDTFVDLARRRRFVPLVIARAGALHARLSLAQENLPAAIRWADGLDLTLDAAVSFLREAELLTLARVRIAQARHAPAPRQEAAIVRLLDRLQLAAEGVGRIGSVIEILVVRALAHQAQGDLAVALPDLERALALAEPEGYVRVFVDEGAPMAALLAQIAGRGSSGAAYAAALVSAVPGAGASAAGIAVSVPGTHAAQRATHDAMVEPLSERELEVLNLIAAGLSNQGIAARLVVAVSTVKKHINNVYGKLDVQSRTQALVRARELHLL